MQALFVIDTSRSMAASVTATSPTRLDRAIAAAVRLRGVDPGGLRRASPPSPTVSSPIFSRSRTSSSFDAVAKRAVAIESPPPRYSSVRATTYGALADIASGNYFDPAASQRIVVLLTDGESKPVDAGRIAARAAGGEGLPARHRPDLEQRRSRLRQRRQAEPGYRPDPSGGAVLAGLAAATGGHAFEEGRLGAASASLGSLAGRGPTAVARGERWSRARPGAVPCRGRARASAHCRSAVP